MNEIINFFDNVIEPCLSLIITWSPRCKIYNLLLLIRRCLTINLYWVTKFIEVDFHMKIFVQLDFQLLLGLLVELWFKQINISSWILLLSLIVDLVFREDQGLWVDSLATFFNLFAQGTMLLLFPILNERENLGLICGHNWDFITAFLLLLAIRFSH